jgi:HAD superfamily hydrolase (TIGR01509 family)
MQRLKGVIFDLDGTLIDSLDTYKNAFNRIVKRYHLRPIDIRDMADFLNQFVSLAQLLTQLYPSLSSHEIKAFMTEMKSEFIALAKDHITLQPHVREVLQTLKEQGMKIGVATGRMSTGSSKWRDLKNLGIDCLIDAVVTGGETKPKPDPASLIKCTLELGLSLNECIFVGDSKADIIAGKSAGVKVIAVSTGVASSDQLAEERPDYMLDNLALLPDHIRNIHQV